MIKHEFWNEFVQTRVQDFSVLELGVASLWNYEMVTILRKAFAYQKWSFTWVTFTSYWIQKQKRKLNV